MRLVIVSHTRHFKSEKGLLAYGPYIREMNLWTEGIEEVSVVAPLGSGSPNEIHEPYNHESIKLIRIPAITLKGIRGFLAALFNSPIILLRLLFIFRKADHIHLRCPGNIGLLGCLVQIFYPSKTKTAKYAGNWDPKSKQPLSYRIQKWILKNTFLTRNMKVLVYGEWPAQTRNIVPFFTATYSAVKAQSIQKVFESPYRLLFVGSLAPGKRPEYAIRLVEQLVMLGHDCVLDLYGDGAERERIESYIENHQLQEFVKLHGNVSSATVEYAYKESHISILPSKSEGWPKAVAESMFWGVIPAVTAISCVPWMLGDGKRGILLTLDLENDVRLLEQILSNEESMGNMSSHGQRWSQQYTLDSFKEAIQKFI